MKKLLHKYKGSIFCLFLALAFLCFNVLPITQYVALEKNNYDTLDFKEYTFVDYEYEQLSMVGNKKYERRIKVKEENKPLYINQIVWECINEEALMSLQPDEVIFCYIRKDTNRADEFYEILEMKSKENTILSLSDYNKERAHNILFSAIFIPSMTIVSFALFGFILYKEKRQ